MNEVKYKHNNTIGNYENEAVANMLTNTFQAVQKQKKSQKLPKLYGIGSGASYDAGSEWMSLKVRNTIAKESSQLVSPRQVDGIKIPTNIYGITNVNFILTQQEGKIKPSDLKDAIMKTQKKQSLYESEKKRIREQTKSINGNEIDVSVVLAEDSLNCNFKTFHEIGSDKVNSHKVREMAYMEEYNDFQKLQSNKSLRISETYCGNRLLSEENKEIIYNRRNELSRFNYIQQWRALNNHDNTIKVDIEIKKCLEMITTSNVTYDLKQNDLWSKRMNTLRNFISLVSKWIIRNRVQKRLHRIYSVLQKHNAFSKDSVREFVDLVWSGKLDLCEKVIPVDIDDVTHIQESTTNSIPIENLSILTASVNISENSIPNPIERKETKEIASKVVINNNTSPIPSMNTNKSPSKESIQSKPQIPIDIHIVAGNVKALEQITYIRRKPITIYENNISTSIPQWLQNTTTTTLKQSKYNYNHFVDTSSVRLYFNQTICEFSSIFSTQKETFSLLEDFNNRVPLIKQENFNAINTYLFADNANQPYIRYPTLSDRVSINADRHLSGMQSFKNHYNSKASHLFECDTGLIPLKTKLEKGDILTDSESDEETYITEVPTLSITRKLLSIERVSNNKTTGKSKNANTEKLIVTNNISTIDENDPILKSGLFENKMRELQNEMLHLFRNRRNQVFERLSTISNEVNFEYFRQLISRPCSNCYQKEKSI